MASCRKQAPEKPGNILLAASRGHAAKGDDDDDDDDDDKHRGGDRHGCATIVKTKIGNAIMITKCG